MNSYKLRQYVRDVHKKNVNATFFVGVKGSFYTKDYTTKITIFNKHSIYLSTFAETKQAREIQYIFSCG